MDLLLRPWRDEDAPALARAITDSLEHLRPWMPWIAHEPLTDDARLALIAEWREAAQAGGDQIFGVWADGEPVGGCGLHRRIGPGGLEIGYWVHAAHTRRGITTEAVRRVCAIAFSDPEIERVEIHHDVENAASGAIPAKLGFTCVEERPHAAEAPAETGRRRIWRLERAAWAASGHPGPA